MLMEHVKYVKLYFIKLMEIVVQMEQFGLIILVKLFLVQDNVSK